MHPQATLPTLLLPNSTTTTRYYWTQTNDYHIPSIKKVQEWIHHQHFINTASWRSICVSVSNDACWPGRQAHHDATKMNGFTHIFLFQHLKHRWFFVGKLFFHSPMESNLQFLRVPPVIFAIYGETFSACRLILWIHVYVSVLGFVFYHIPTWRLGFV